MYDERNQIEAILEKRIYFGKVMRIPGIRRSNCEWTFELLLLCHFAGRLGPIPLSLMTIWAGQYLTVSP